MDRAHSIERSTRKKDRSALLCLAGNGLNLERVEFGKCKRRLDSSDRDGAKKKGVFVVGSGASSGVCCLLIVSRFGSKSRRMSSVAVPFLWLLGLK
jgi:hypothetical protein